MIPSKTDFANNLLALKKILFPGSCSLCREGLSATQQILCSNCIDNLPYVVNFCVKCAEPLLSMGICPTCQKRPPNFRLCLTLCDYSYPIPEAINHIKTNPFALETKQLSVLFANQLPAAYANLEMPDIIIPMPSHPIRILSRGFNQSNLIAQFLSNKLKGTIVLNNICLRKHLGKPQRSHTRRQRMKILNSTFESKKHPDIKGKSLALVDDVVTTGSTAKAATASLLKAGAKSVDLWCIAKTSWHNHSSSIKM
ncbi:MAG: ComF family protein [Porticoccaceae bacterium]